MRVSMSSTPCVFCGKPLPPTATFCPSCGAARPGIAAVAPIAPPDASYSGPAPGASLPLERAALTRIEWAAIVGLIAGAVGVALDVVLRSRNLAAVSSSSGGGVTILPSTYETWAALLVVSGVLGLIEILLYREGFRGLSRLDPRFRTPSNLTLVCFVGTILTLLGVGVLLYALYSASVCSGIGDPLVRSCISLTAFGAGLGITILGAIVAVVGFIGMLLGVWRLGNRFGDGVFKVAAVLLLFPFLNLIGSILVLVSARAVRQRAESAAGAGVAPGAR
jgi:hypothetical protein